MDKDANSYDVIIIGGGIAGSTLALQICKEIPDATVCVVERRKEISDLVAYKVGESCSELGASYLSSTLGLKDYLLNDHLLKIGTRFFLNSPAKNRIDDRVEFGPVHATPQKTFHVEKGRLERDLLSSLTQLGVTLLSGAKVTDVEIDKHTHGVTIEQGNGLTQLNCKWLIDASGRNAFLARKFDLHYKIDHHINSVWFRTSDSVRVDDWSSQPYWTSQLGHGIRGLSTNHLMGEGYWIWIIPLVSGGTSIGLVADPRFHAWDHINTMEKLLKWIEANEPALYDQLASKVESILDFKVMKDFSFNSKKYYSSDRWALTGDACAFLDPLYSPGLDFIALGNSWITELVKANLNGEEITLRSHIYETTNRQLLEGWLKVYQNSYKLLKYPQLMIYKIVWDWATYWAVPNPMFNNKGYTNLRLIKQFSDSKRNLGQTFNMMNDEMQSFFQYCYEHIDSFGTGTGFHNIFDLSILYDFQVRLHEKLAEDEVMDRIARNLEELKVLGKEIRRVLIDQISLDVSLDHELFTPDPDVESELIERLKLDLQGIDLTQ